MNAWTVENWCVWSGKKKKLKINNSRGCRNWIKKSCWLVFFKKTNNFSPRVNPRKFGAATKSIDVRILIIKWFLSFPLVTKLPLGFSKRRGAKDLCACMQRTSGAWSAKSLPSGVQGTLRVLGALGLYMLFHAIWALFWSILIQNWKWKDIVDQNLEGVCTYCVPTWIRHWMCEKR